jgi:hypothetical protein
MQNGREENVKNYNGRRLCEIVSVLRRVCTLSLSSDIGRIVSEYARSTVLLTCFTPPNCNCQACINDDFKCIKKVRRLLWFKELVSKEISLEMDDQSDLASPAIDFQTPWTCTSSFRQFSPDLFARAFTPDPLSRDLWALGEKVWVKRASSSSWLALATTIAPFAFDYLINSAAMWPPCAVALRWGIHRATHLIVPRYCTLVVNENETTKSLASVRFHFLGINEAALIEKRGKIHPIWNLQSDCYINASCCSLIFYGCTFYVFIDRCDFMFSINFDSLQSPEPPPTIAATQWVKQDINLLNKAVLSACIVDDKICLSHNAGLTIYDPATGSTKNFDLEAGPCCPSI